jgi:hypothetical protein
MRVRFDLMNEKNKIYCLSRLGYDYRHLMEEKRRIGYTGPGLSTFFFFSSHIFIDSFFL